MTTKNTLAIAVLALATGCATNARKVKLQNEAALAAEAHGLWTRPTEIGFKMGDEISATAKATKVFGFNTGESKPGGVNLSVVTSGLGGTGANLSTTGQFAAHKAVTEAGAEGIYVTRVETDSKGFPFIVRRETVTVTGRALTLDNYGPVEEGRADQWRFRRFQPKTVVIKDTAGAKGNPTPVQIEIDE